MGIGGKGSEARAGQRCVRSTHQRRPGLGLPLKPPPTPPTSPSPGPRCPGLAWQRLEGPLTPVHELLQQVLQVVAQLVAKNGKPAACQGARGDVSFEHGARRAATLTADDCVQVAAVVAWQGVFVAQGPQPGPPPWPPHLLSKLAREDMRRSQMAAKSTRAAVSTGEACLSTNHVVRTRATRAASLRAHSTPGAWSRRGTSDGHASRRHHAAREPHFPGQSTVACNTHVSHQLTDSSGHYIDQNEHS